MGVVYHALDPRNGREVALKTVRMPHEGLLQSLRREILALAKLRHPGIVPIIDEGIQEGVPWYAMEFVQGMGLRQWLWPDQDDFARTTLNFATQPLSAPEKIAPSSGAAPRVQNSLSVIREGVRMMLKLCDALSFLHGEGLVHRDLKPDNILIRSDDTPILVDFGLAAKFSASGGRESLDVAPSLSGTVTYISPEQIRGELVDARADLYSLGCILYEILTGRPPFVDPKPMRVLWHHLCTEPLIPSDLEPALAHLLARLLAKERRQRIGYAHDVALLLSKILGEPAPPRPARTYLYRPEFGGRERELGFLDDRLAELREAKGCYVLLGGESGIGKTRLALEMANRATAFGIRVFHGECLASSQEALHPLVRPLQQFADLCRERGEQETARLLGPRGKILALYEPSLGSLPGVASFSEPDPLPVDAARARLFGVLGEVLAGVAELGAFLLVLDDLQWADELTRQFLLHALQSGMLARLPIAFLGTYRVEEMEDGIRRMMEHSQTQSLELRRLDEESVAGMVGDMLALSPPPRMFSRFLAAQSKGNPFFVAEYLRTAVEEEILWRDEEGDWQIPGPTGSSATEDDYHEIPLPGSMLDLLQRRLAGLSHGAWAIAEALAILGREASAMLIQEMTRMEDEPWLHGLADLLRRQVLEEPRPGLLRFAHDKIREVAEQQPSPSKRKALHHLAAEAIERLFPEERSHYLSELGRHWEGCGELELAQRRYLEGARWAQQRYALREAERLYRMALGLALPPSLSSVEARHGLATHILVEQSRYDDALEQLIYAAGDARRLGLGSEEAEAQRKLGFIHFRKGDFNLARGYYERALQMHRAEGSLLLEGRTLRDLALLDAEIGQLETALARNQEALSIFREVDARVDEALLLLNLGQLAQQRGQLGEAIAHCERSAAQLRGAGHRFGLIEALSKLGHLHFQRGDLPQSRACHERASAMAREVGARQSEAQSSFHLAALEKLAGQFEDARRLYSGCLESFRELGAQGMEAATLNGLAGLAIEQGFLDESADLFHQARELFHRLGDLASEASSLAGLARVRLQQARIPEARELYQEAIRLSRQGGRSGQLVRLLISVVTLERQQSHLEQAEQNLRIAEETIRNTEDPISRVRLICEQGHLALARRQSGQTYLERAEKLLHSLGFGSESELGKSIEHLRQEISMASQAAGGEE